jgi:hypothetical protein
VKRIPVLRKAFEDINRCMANSKLIPKLHKNETGKGAASKFSWSDRAQHRFPLEIKDKLSHTKTAGPGWAPT